jgi:gas vesicle protein
MPVGEPPVHKCWTVKNFTRYHVKEYGKLPAKDEKAIMSEIYARGPVTCGFATNDDFDYEYFGGVYIDKRNSTEIDHDVEVVGWGETADGVKYWQVRNSWGTYWGENGFFKILRGVNHARFEEECVFAIPDISEEGATLSGKLVGGMYGLREKTMQARQDDGDAAIYSYANSVRSQQDKKKTASSSTQTNAQTSNNKEIAALPEKAPPAEKLHASKPAEATTTKHPAVSPAPSEDSAGLEGHVGVTVGVIIGCAAVLGLAVILYRAIRNSASSSYEQIT